MGGAANTALSEQGRGARVNSCTPGKALNCHGPRPPAAGGAKEGTRASPWPAGPGLAGPELRCCQLPGIRVARRQPQATSSPGPCHPELRPDPRSGWRQEAGEWPGRSSPQLDVLCRPRTWPHVCVGTLWKPGPALLGRPGAGPHPADDRSWSPGCRAGLVAARQAPWTTCHSPVAGTRPGRATRPDRRSHRHGLQGLRHHGWGAWLHRKGSCISPEAP